jgi:hypothetical protein
MKLPLSTLLLIASCATSYAQLNRFGIMASNQTVSFPVTGIGNPAHSQFHPGLDAFLEKGADAEQKHQILYSLWAGIQYHRFFQTGLRLYGWGDYCFQPGGTWQIKAGLGAGYLHGFPDYERFTQQDDGSWKKVPALNGRPQFMAGFGLGVSRALKTSDPDGLRLELRWRSMLQLPFAGSYIPLLPSNALMLGLSVPVETLKGGKK